MPDFIPLSKSVLLPMFSARQLCAGGDAALTTGTEVAGILPVVDHAVVTEYLEP